MCNRTESETKFFEEMILSRYVPLFRFLFTICGDKELCKDITQDTMVACWEKLELMYGYEDISGAVSAIGRNKLRDHYRKEQRRVKIVDAPMDIVLEISGEECDFERTIRDDRNRELLNLINQLRPDQARMILLYYYFEMPLQEVAQILNVNYNTVLSWHRRSLIALGRMAEEAGLGVRRRESNGTETINKWGAGKAFAKGNK